MLTIASPPSRRAAALLATAAALALGACGSDSDDSPSGSTTPSAGGGSAATSAPSNEQDTARVRLAQCLRENGIDVPDGGLQGPPPPGVDPDDLQAALEGPCQELQAGAFGGHGPDDQDFQDAFTKFAQCMRRNGVDFPDPDPNGGFGDIHGAIDPSDPEVQAGMEKCQENLPQGGAGAP